MGPSLDGSLLWHATQLARNTALPLSRSETFADGASDCFEQAPMISAEANVSRSFCEGFIGRFELKSQPIAVDLILF